MQHKKAFSPLSLYIFAARSLYCVAMLTFFFWIIAIVPFSLAAKSCTNSNSLAQANDVLESSWSEWKHDSDKKCTLVANYNCIQARTKGASKKNARQRLHRANEGTIKSKLRLHPHLFLCLSLAEGSELNSFIIVNKSKVTEQNLFALFEFDSVQAFCRFCVCLHLTHFLLLHK